jgi:hypothetical protein
MPTEVGKPGNIRRGRLKTFKHSFSAMESPGLQTDIQEFTTPNPPRYRWVKRSVGIAAILLLLLVGLWFWWAHAARNRLRAAIDGIHARGEPIELEDFAVAPIPANENAAIYYINAHAALLQGNQIGTQWMGWDGFLSPSAIASLGALTDGETKAMGIVRQARGYSQSVWPLHYQSPVSTILLTHLSAQRSLSIVLASATFIAHQRDQDDLAIEYIRDMHHQADSMEHYAPFLLGMLVAGGLDQLGSLTALNLSRDLKIADASSNTSTNASTRPGGASRQQVIDLIADLSDELQFQFGASRAMWGERLYAIDPQSPLNRGMPVFLTRVMRPAIELEASRFVPYDTQVGKALSQTSYPAAMAAYPSSAALTGNGNFIPAIPQMVSGITAPALQRIIWVHFNTMTMRRAAVIALALRLYRQDHHGAWPDSLEALAPTYLPALPVDPFSPAGASFRYKPAANGAAPTLYSVAKNGVDDGGKMGPHRTQPYEGLDWVFDLVAPPPPATEPSDSSQTTGS